MTVTRLTFKVRRKKLAFRCDSPTIKFRSQRKKFDSALRSATTRFGKFPFSLYFFSCFCLFYARKRDFPFRSFQVELYDYFREYCQRKSDKIWF